MKVPCPTFAIETAPLPEFDVAALPVPLSCHGHGVIKSVSMTFVNKPSDCYHRNAYCPLSQVFMQSHARQSDRP